MDSPIKYAVALQWEVTPFCNQDCIHCYNYWRSENIKSSDIKFNESVSSEYYENIARKIIQAKPVSVTITGGEPLSVFDKIKSSIDLLLESGIRVGFNTNAVLMNDNIANFLRDRKIKLFISLPCSDPVICDLITKSKDSLKKIVDGINVCLRNNMEFDVNMVVSRLNLDYMFETAKFTKDVLKSNVFCATRVSKPLNSGRDFDINLLTKEDIHKMIENADKIVNELDMKVYSAAPFCTCGYESQREFDVFGSDRKCSAGKFSYGLSATGDIKACMRDSRSYGNINEVSFEQAMSNMEEWRNGSMMPVECTGCKHIYSCGGGCRVDQYHKSENMNDLDSHSVVENRDVEFKVVKKQRFARKSSTYILNSDAKFVQEKSCIRINTRYGLVYATEKLHLYLIGCDKYTVDSAISYFDVPEKEARMILERLLKENIILELS